MLHKDKILSLRDLALDHLPKVRAERDRMKAHGSIAALRAVAIAPIKTSFDVASTAIEKRAAVLLDLIHQHPYTSTEWLVPSEDGSERELEEILMKDALRNKPMTEANLLETAKQLCELSGAPLPPWMIIKTPEPAAKVEAETATSLSVEDIPGKMPRTAIGKLAIHAAWEIERVTDKLATPNQVIVKLQKWVESEPVLVEIMPHGVVWTTTKGGDKKFDTEACAKALNTWNKSRP